MDQRDRVVGDRFGQVNVLDRPLQLAQRLAVTDRIELDPLGSGSDFTPFLQHAGIASLNLGFGGEDDSGSYHSIYDSFDHYVRFSDTTFVYGVAQAKVCGRLVLRLADADVLPFEFGALSRQIAKFTTEVKELTAEMRDETATTNKLIADGTLVAAADPKQPYVVPAAKAAVPYLNFAPLENSAEKLRASVQAWTEASKAPMPAARRAELDRLYAAVERSLTRADGLPGRPWYRHYVYAPGQYTGYGVKTFPGVREAIELRRWDDAQQQIGVLAGVLNDCAAAIDRATALLEQK
mgnify:CR=1 FL=1